MSPCFQLVLLILLSGMDAYQYADGNLLLRPIWQQAENSNNTCANCLQLRDFVCCRVISDYFTDDICAYCADGCAFPPPEQYFSPFNSLCNQQVSYRRSGVNGLIIFTLLVGYITLAYFC